MTPEPRITPVKAPKNPAVRWYTAQAVFPEATPFGDDKLTLPCPGVHTHKSQPGVFRPGDCVIHFEGKTRDLPYLYCAHDSCDNPRSAIMADAQKTLDRAIWLAEMRGAGLWKDSMAGKPLRRKAGRIMGATARRLDPGALIKSAQQQKGEGLLADLATRALAAAPLPCNVDPDLTAVGQTRAHIRHLYHQDDIIWFGTVELGRPTKVGYINLLLEWHVTADPFIGMSTYGPESLRRLDGEVVTSPWIVLEADNPVGDIDAREWAMRLAACLLAEGIPPRCVIDSGGKSAHVWLPRAPYLERYADGLADKTRNKMHSQILHVDPACLRIGQPVRLAGAWGEGRERAASLLYLQP